MVKQIGKGKELQNNKMEIGLDRKINLISEYMSTFRQVKGELKDVKWFGDKSVHEANMPINEQDILNNLEPDPDGRPFGDDMTTVLDKELESIFPTTTLEQRLLPMELQAQDWPFAADDQSEQNSKEEESALGVPETGELLDMQSASELGLIPEDIFERLASDNEIKLATGELKAE